MRCPRNTIKNMTQLSILHPVFFDRNLPKARCFSYLAAHDGRRGKHELDKRHKAGFSLDCPKHDNAPVLTKRKPLLLFTLDGLLLLTLPTCMLFALLFQLPPRMIRLDPLMLSAPVSSTALLAGDGSNSSCVQSDFAYSAHILDTIFCL